MLSRIAAVSAAGARRQNPEHTEGTPNRDCHRQAHCHPPTPIVILSEAKDLCK
jgi:hypothetical protein